MPSSRFPLLPILVACASALAYKQLSSVPQHAHLGTGALVVALGCGAYAALQLILGLTCDLDPLVETTKLLQTFSSQEAKQGIQVDSVIGKYNRLQDDAHTTQADRNLSYSALVDSYYRYVELCAGCPLCRR